MLRTIALLLPPVLAAAASPAAAEEARVEGSKPVCRPAAAKLGSRIKRAKICRSEAEWEEADRASRAANITVKAPQPEPWERTRPQ